MAYIQATGTESTENAKEVMIFRFEYERNEEVIIYPKISKWVMTHLQATATEDTENLKEVMIF